VGLDRGGAWFALRLNLYTFVKKISLSIDYRVSLITRDSVENMHASFKRAKASSFITTPQKMQSVNP